MIKGSATIQFGSGSVGSMSGVDKDSGFGAIAMKSFPPGKIGRKFTDRDQEEVYNNPDVVMYFTNVESLDSFMTSLTKIREAMVAFKENTNEREKKLVIFCYP